MINLNKIINDFISGTIELNDVIEKSGISYFKLVDYIKKYCMENNILMDEDISYRLNAPISEILNLLRQNITYKEISRVYKCSSQTLKNRLVKYCEKNNTELPKVNRGPKEKPLPMEEIYELKKQGLTYEEIGEKHSCTYGKIRQRLKKYCKQNNLKIPKTKRKPRARIIELPIEEIYKLKSQDMSYRKIAEKYGCTYETIRQRLIEYEEELVLRNKYLEILLQDFTRIKDDILNKTIGSFYDGKENKKQDDYPLIKK